MVVEQTYSMLKPGNGVKNQASILKMITDANFKIIKSKMMKFSKEQAEEFYGEHKGKPFFPPLVEYMTSGDIFAMVLEKENCVTDFRAFIGVTDPKKAAPNTIRQLYGTDISHNAIHASDSVSSANREIKLVFE